MEVPCVALLTARLPNPLTKPLSDGVDGEGLVSVCHRPQIVVVMETKRNSAS
jgi:hypothetical protein